MTIRAVTVDDTDVWSEMRTALWPDTDDDHLSEIHDYFNDRSSDMVAVFIIEEGLDSVGFIELNIRNYAEGSRQTKVPYVEGWYIKPDYQGRGYGKRLMQHAEAWAMSLGYSELASDAELDNERSISVHKQLGFQETDRIVCFIKHLTTPSE